MNSPTNLWYVFPAMLAGLVIPFQAAINARLGRHAGHPIFGAMTNFIVGALVLAVLMLPFLRRFNGAAGLSQAPVWAYTGGMLGATFVFMSLVSVTKLGAANLLVASVAGQIIAAMLIDRYGLVGLPVREISLQRIAGIGLVIVGLALVTFEWRKAGV